MAITGAAGVRAGLAVACCLGLAAGGGGHARTAAGNTNTALRRARTMFGPTGPDAVPPVTLKPGALAVAVFTVAGGRPPCCPPPYLSLRVTPPGSHRAILVSAWLHPYLRGYLPACTRIRISPAVPAADACKP